MPVGSPREVTFTDDPQWRAAITNIFLTVNGDSGADLMQDAQIVSGKISLPLYTYNVIIPRTWVIKATGYQDATVTVVIQ